MVFYLQQTNWYTIFKTINLATSKNNNSNNNNNKNKTNTENTLAVSSRFNTSNKIFPLL